MKTQTLSTVPEPMMDEDLIVLDFDSTLFDLMTAWLNAVYAATGERLMPEEVTRWDFDKQMKCGDIVYGLRTPEMYANVDPMPGAQEAVRWLSERGYRLHCASVDTGPYLVVKQFLLEKYFPEIESLDVVGTKEGWQTNFRIDDSPKSLMGARSGLLFSQPHNASLGINWWIDNAQLYRLKQWADLPQLIEYMEWAGYIYTPRNK